MNIPYQNQMPQAQIPHSRSDTPLILPFSAFDSTYLSLVGGKAANLGEMTQAGLPVPPGFCVTTVAYAAVAEGAGLDAELAELATLRPNNATALEQCAAVVRSRLLSAPVPAAISEAITQAYLALGDEGAAVAVRSSATAEDLALASFAGQQDTYLNICGVDAVLDAVRRCWASLWTNRAVQYRASHGIDPRGVQLAVVVQRMVDAQVSGVLFTANPLTGRRRQAVIDASPGLGEAVVSGAVNPDHFVINTTTGEIVERHLGDKRLIIRALADGGTQKIERTAADNQPCLTDETIRALAQLGARVEAHYATPQDTEWAIDDAGVLWLTQTRPITTLFPLPADAPTTDDVLRVYFSINVVQGVYRPFTPMGGGVFRYVTSSVALFLGLPQRNVRLAPTVLKEAASRLFVDITLPLRTTLGRNLLQRAMQVMEARSAVMIRQLITDPRLSLLPVLRPTFLRIVMHLLLHSGLPKNILQVIFRPQAAQKRVLGLKTEVRALGATLKDGSALDQLSRIEQIFIGNMARIVFGIVPVVFTTAGFIMLTKKLLAGLMSEDEFQTVLRSLPYNPTTEMDLSLWTLAQHIHAEPAAEQAMRELTSEQLAQNFRQGILPPGLQQDLVRFLRDYGHRSVAEIDLGMPRWSEDPTYIFNVLANYLQISKPELAPDVQFDRGIREAEAMIIELTRRAKRKGYLRGLLVSMLLKRARMLMGLRELPKFYFVLLFAQVRATLQSVGETLVNSGCISKSDDIFFLSLAEAREAVQGVAMHTLVGERRANYAQELQRRHIPRILLSDGTEPDGEAGEMQPVLSSDAALKGTPASAGKVTAKARVILEPMGARLEPGEILIAPSTDPGWTPLFLSAGGLVMEMGGSMSHGAVVAREYGIPAVVGVHAATERITTGQWITVNGSTGVISIEDKENEEQS